VTKHHLLVVEDDATLAKALAMNLRARGYDVAVATTGAAALRCAVDEHPDVILLDLGLPDMDGADVIIGVRAWSSVPIIVLSARQSSHDKVDALDAGADDYVTKPFAIDELLARLRAALRRPTAADETTAIVATPAFTVDLAAHQVLRDGRPVRLTPTEWAILEQLVRHRGRLVSQRELLSSVWGPQYVAERQYLRVYLGQLRRKLEPDPSRPEYLITEPGMGYRFVDGSPD
jgi:two-component system, OmpR family, KDP operon response regulator KdpE